MLIHYFSFWILLNGLNQILSNLTLKAAFDLVLFDFPEFYISSSILNYTEGSIRMNQNRFLRPLINNITITETDKTLIANNIIITLISYFRFSQNGFTKHISFSDVIQQYEIKTIKLERKTQMVNGKIYITEFEITRPFISKSTDLMSSKKFNEFQEDTNAQYYKVLSQLTLTHTEIILQKINLKSQFDTILEYSLFEQGKVANGTLKYGIQDIIVDEGKLVNN